MEAKYRALKQKLQQEHEFPLKYMYKFIVPSGKEEELRPYFEDAEVKIKQSSKGNYTSFTAIKIELSAEAIIQKYKSLSHIKGLISL